MLGIYCRKSVNHEDTKSHSVEVQEQLGIECANKLGLAYKVYIDDGISGTLPLEKRPALLELLEDIVFKDITSVYYYDESRLTRSIDTHVVISKTFKDNNIQVYTSSGKQSSSIEAELQSNILASMNAFYSQITSKKIKSALNAKAATGKAMGSNTPIGYYVDEDGYYQIKDDEVPLIKFIYSQCLDGKGCYTISNMIEEKFNRRMATGTVRNIIANKAYIGEKYHKEYKIKIDPIIDDMDWYKAQEQLIKNRNYVNPKKRHNNLLRKLFYCECGTAMHYKHQTDIVRQGPSRYKCGDYRKGGCRLPSIRVKELEDFLLISLIAEEHLKEHIEFNLMVNSGTDFNGIKARNETLKRKIAKYDKNIKKLVEAVLNDVMEDDDIKEAMTELKKDKRKAEDEMRSNHIRIEEARTSTPIADISDIDIYKLTTEQKQVLLSKLFKRITKVDSEFHHKITLEFHDYRIPEKVYYLDKKYKYALDTEDGYIITLTDEKELKIQYPVTT